MSRAIKFLEELDTKKFREVARQVKSSIKKEHRGVDVRISLPSDKGIVELSVANPYMSGKEVEEFGGPIRKLGYKVKGRIHYYP